MFGEEKMKTRERSNFETTFFMVHGHSSRSTITPSEGPKGFITILQEIGPWKLDHEKRPSSMVRLHGPTSWSIVKTNLKCTH